MLFLHQKDEQMKAVAIKNTVFFPKFGEILIQWRGCHTMVAMTQGGVMVRLKGYENYYLCLDSSRVFSKRSGKLLPLREFFEAGKIFYWLSLNGNKNKVFLSRILEDNLNGIEHFFKQNESKKIKNVTTH